MKYVVTGSRGFVATHLRRILEQRGDSVIEIDREHPVGLDLLRILPSDLYRLMAGADGVFHLAANADWRACETNPALSWENVATTYQVLEAAASLGLPAVIASTAQVYGTPLASPVHEYKHLWPETVYGVGKKACEDLASMFTARMETRVSNLNVARFWNIYGPGQDQAVTYKSAFIPNIIRLMAKSQDSGATVVKMRSDPGWTRDWVHVEDICEALLLILGSTGCATFNVAGGNAMRLADTVHMLGDLMGYYPQIEWAGEKPFLPDPGRHSWAPYQADISLLKGLGWSPKWGMREGLAKTAEGMGVRIK